MTMTISLQMRRPEILNQNIFMEERRINLRDWNHLVNFLSPVFDLFHLNFTNLISSFELVHYGKPAREYRLPMKMPEIPGSGFLYTNKEMSVIRRS